MILLKKAQKKLVQIVDGLRISAVQNVLGTGFKKEGLLCLLNLQMLLCHD